MPVSLACAANDHTRCPRPSCECWCGHPDRVERQRRAAELLARPAPTRRATTRPKTSTPKNRAAPKPPEPTPPPPAPRTRRPPRPPKTPRARRPRVEIPLDEVIAAYQAGEGAKTIARRHGTTANTILRRLREVDVPIRRQGDRSRALPDDVIATAYQAGATLDTLAAQHHVSATTIAHHLRRHGITIRRPGTRSGRRQDTT